MGADLRLRLGPRGKKAAAHRIEAGVLFKVPPGHLRLSCKATEVDHGAGMGNGVTPDGGWIEVGHHRVGTRRCVRLRLGFTRDRGSLVAYGVVAGLTAVLIALRSRIGDGFSRSSVIVAISARLYPARNPYRPGLR